MSSQSHKQLETFLDTLRDGGYNYIDPQERPSVVIRTSEPIDNSDSFTATQGRDWIVSIEFVFAEIAFV